VRTGVGGEIPEADADDSAGDAGAEVDADFDGAAVAVIRHAGRSPRIDRVDPVRSGRPGRRRPGKVPGGQQGNCEHPDGGDHHDAHEAGFTTLGRDDEACHKKTLRRGQRTRLSPGPRPD